MDPGHNDHTITTAGIRTGPRSPPRPRPDPVQLDAITPNTPAKAGEEQLCPNPLPPDIRVV